MTKKDAVDNYDSATVNGKSVKYNHKNAPLMQCLRQYISDMSFENIAAQKGNIKQGRPDINVQVNLDAENRQDNYYDVIQKITLKAILKGDVIFLLELEYVGSFLIKNVPEDQMHPLLMIECPRLLFPFVRRIIQDVTVDGGYPPLNIDNIDYVSLYRNELKKRRANLSASSTDQKIN